MIEGVAFLIIWAALLFCWHQMLKLAELNLFSLSIPAFVIVGFYGYQYVGLPILYFRLDEIRAVVVTDDDLIFKVFFYTSITITLMLAGFIAGRHYFGSLGWAYMRGNTTQTVVAGGRRQTFGLAVLVSICTIVLLLYLSKIGFQQIALITVLGLGANDLTIGAARSAMGNSFDGSYHLYKMFMRDLLTFAAFALYAQYLIKRTNTVSVMLLLTLVVAIFSLLTAIEKGPIAYFLIAMFLVYVFVRRQGHVPIRGFIFLGLALVAILTAANVFLINIEDPLNALANTLSRAFTGSIQPSYHYLEYFPAVQDFVLGRSFPNPRGILPFENFRLTTEIMAWAHPELREIDVVGSMPAVYWGEMYANFGFLGVLIAPFYVGFGLYWLNVVIFRLQPTPLSIALVVWLMMHFQTLSISGLSDFLVDTYMLAVFLSFAVLALFVGRGVIKIRSNNA